MVFVAELRVEQARKKAQEEATLSLRQSKLPRCQRSPRNMEQMSMSLTSERYIPPIKDIILMGLHICHQTKTFATVPLASHRMLLLKASPFKNPIHSAQCLMPELLVLILLWTLIRQPVYIDLICMRQRWDISLAKGGYHHYWSLISTVWHDLS
jgi:hypothetical protein